MRYIKEYDNAWPESFEKISGVIRANLPDGCLVHHVGSTSIPGMPAKDVIDLTIECPAGSMAAVIKVFRKFGCEHQGDLGITGREAFRTLQGSAAESLPPHHLYACEESATELRKHLAFRDYLIAHPDRLSWLARQKRLADRKADTRDGYIENKAQAYATITAEAMAWAARLGR